MGSPPPPPTTAIPIAPRTARRWAVVALVGLNAGVGWGLVRRGYHWPLDVLGSWCLSVLLLSGVAWSVRRALSVSGPPREAGRGPRLPRASPAPASPDR
ncbi:phosphatase PAP2 family protein [Streptomyces sp. NPDC057676]|uniref:phosphatase PAP2 family protein n=1 Tax=Streptomyces sp. NPDC057676 TaxID=3346205 RepID=UPI0036786C5C